MCNCNQELLSWKFVLLAESVKFGTAVKGKRQCCSSSVCLFAMKIWLIGRDPVYFLRSIRVRELIALLQKFRRNLKYVALEGFGSEGGLSYEGHSMSLLRKSQFAPRHVYHLYDYNTGKVVVCDRKKRSRCP